MEKAGQARLGPALMTKWTGMGLILFSPGQALSGLFYDRLGLDMPWPYMTGSMNTPRFAPKKVKTYGKVKPSSAKLAAT